ncbi:MAG: hypothetical protein HZA59_08735 [Hydrogenophilales bacterium]|nr:hypothetical protein [Hydrogenophilales bacterium]
MAKLRIKTTWFRKDAGRAEDETASVLALNFWKMASKSVDDISQANYDIGGPARGFGIIAEMGAFMLHIADRMLFERVDDERRTALIGAAGVKLGEYIAANIHDLLNDDHDTRDYQGEFLDFLNRRSDDYATFEFPPDEPNYAIKRYLANVMRERMEAHDQTWIIDQIIEFQAPEAIETVAKLINGFFPRQAQA